MGLQPNVPVHTRGERGVESEGVNVEQQVVQVALPHSSGEEVHGGEHGVQHGAAQLRATATYVTCLKKTRA